MSTALIYHWWTECDRAEDDVSNPLIFSIASVRAYNKFIPIYVINLSSKRIDWGVYPKKLNFKVYNKKSKFPENSYYQSKLMSRVFDINEVSRLIPESDILFCDSDVFWIKDPLPLMNEMSLFNCNSNNGVFYYRKTSKAAMNFLLEWQRDIDKTINNHEFRIEILSNFGFSLNFNIHDELVMRYTQLRHFDLYESIPLVENNIIFTPIVDPKNVHIIRAFVGMQNRLKVAKYIQEVNQSIKEGLGSTDDHASADQVYPLKDVTLKEVIKLFCTTGNEERAINYCLSKLC